MMKVADRKDVKLENLNIDGSFEGVDVSDIDLNKSDEDKKVSDKEDAYLDPQTVKDVKLDKKTLENLKENLKHIPSFEGADVSDIDTNKINEENYSEPKIRR